MLIYLISAWHRLCFRICPVAATGEHSYPTTSINRTKPLTDGLLVLYSFMKKGSFFPFLLVQWVLVWCCAGLFAASARELLSIFEVFIATTFAVSCRIISRPGLIVMLCCGVKTGDFHCLNNRVMLIRSCAQPLHLGLKLLDHYVLGCNLLIWFYLIRTFRLLAYMLCTVYVLIF